MKHFFYESDKNGHFIKPTIWFYLLFWIRKPVYLLKNLCKWLYEKLWDIQRELGHVYFNTFTRKN
jgi:hypothetical protein